MHEVIYYLSKFEFASYLLTLSIIFVFSSFIIKPKLFKFLLLSLFGILIPLFLFEVYFAITMSNIVSRRNNFTLSNLDTEEIVIQSSKTNKEREYQYYKSTIYSNWFRYNKSNFNSEDGFIFLGCSFTYGAGLDDEETLPYYFSQLYDFNKFVLNCSMGGRGTNFAFNIMNSDIIYSFNKNVNVKYFIYSVISDQIDRNFNVSTFNLADDNFVLENGKFVRAKEPLGFLKVIFRKSYIFHKFFMDFVNERNKDFRKQYFIDMIVKMNNLAEEKYNAELIVVLWPDIEKQIVEKLRVKDINIVLLDEKFENDEYKISNDQHPNGKANKEIAQILFDYINNKS